MQWYLLIPLLLLPLMVRPGADPAWSRSSGELRELECERLSTETASRRYPGQIITSAPRGDFVERSALICTERLMRPGLRTARDEAILTSLSARASELAALVEAQRPDLKGHTFLVETYYPSAQVSVKLSFATQNALVDLGLRVSDRTPTLAAGDVAVLTRMEPEQAYPAACQRYFNNESLRDGDALLAVVSRDARATVLHGGLCVAGQWTWLL